MIGENVGFSQLRFLGAFSFPSTTCHRASPLVPGIPPPKSSKFSHFCVITPYCLPPPPTTTFSSKVAPGLSASVFDKVVFLVLFYAQRLFSLLLPSCCKLRQQNRMGPSVPSLPTGPLANQLRPLRVKVPGNPSAQEFVDIFTGFVVSLFSSFVSPPVPSYRLE